MSSIDPVSTREMEAVFAWVGGCSRNAWISANNVTATVTDTNKTRWRASTYDGIDGLSASFRRMPHRVPALEQLGLPNQVRVLTAHTSGLVIVAGPARSGRTTTLASLIGLVNSTREAHILTLEHPVEYLHQPKYSLISQRDVPHVARSKYLRSTLRIDSDVVLVGECLTAADFEMCLSLAAAGHLVLTCMHAPDGAGACERIAATTGTAGQVLLSQVLIGVVTQRLLPDAADPRGCHVVAEVMLASPSVKKLIKPGGDNTKLSTYMADRQASLDYALASKCLNNHITDYDARHKSVNPEAFDMILSKARMS